MSIITLLLKTDKDTKLLKNWRHISLSNVNCEIMTKCITTRLKAVLTKIMNEHQFGLMEERYIRDNIRGPLSVINLAEDEISLVFLLSIDFEKAFDAISWKFLYKISCIL